MVFTKKLKKRNFNEEQIEAHLAFITLTKTEQKYVDRFRNRIIFPVKEFEWLSFCFWRKSFVQNFKFAKYINSPETEFYKKGNNLYNIQFC